MIKLTRNAQTAFWNKVLKTETCWLWKGSLNQGYGRLSIEARTRLHHLRAHRVAYSLLVRPPLDSEQLDHLCRVRGCVNPAHLEVVSGKENVLRVIGITAQNARKLLCSRGHPFDEENTYKTKLGRHCKECIRLHHGRQMQKRKTIRRVLREQGFVARFGKNYWHETKRLYKELTCKEA